MVLCLFFARCPPARKIRKKSCLNFQKTPVIFLMKEAEKVRWRCAIWTMLDAGASKQSVKELYGSQLACSTLHGLIGSYQSGWFAGELPVDKPRSGRPSDISQARKRKVVEDLKAGSSVRVAAARNDMSIATVSGAAKEQKVVARRLILRPFLEDRHLESRLAYAQRLLASDNEVWKQVLWTDESAVALCRTERPCQWVDFGSHPEELSKCSYPKTVWVWAGISWQGRTPLLFLTWDDKGGFKAHHYQAQVLSKVPGMMADLLGEDGMFMEDGSRVHTAKANKGYREQKGIKSFPEKPHKWPANSPDLNPIENVWADMKHAINRLPEYPTSAAAMKKDLKTYWKTMTQEKCRNFIGDYQKRLELVVEAKGGNSGH